jgi:hypothetical protein
MSPPTGSACVAGRRAAAPLASPRVPLPDSSHRHRAGARSRVSRPRWRHRLPESPRSMHEVVFVGRQARQRAVLFTVCAAAVALGFRRTRGCSPGLRLRCHVGAQPMMCAQRTERMVSRLCHSSPRRAGTLALHCLGGAGSGATSTPRVATLSAHSADLSVLPVAGGLKPAPPT